MRILVLGGTQFLGRHVVEHALAAGHAVTLFNRGQTRPELFPEAEKIRGDRDGRLDELAQRDFDAVVDTSGYVPRIVRETIDALGDVGHYTFVSSISVYADLSRPGVDEDAPVAPLAEETEEYRSEAYGPLKALCEQAVQEVYGDRATIVRPGLIVGPWDPTGRFTYWPVRVAAGGEVLAPEPRDAPVQVIDVRDLGGWILRLAADGVPGTFNATGPRPPLSIEQTLGTCREVAGSDARFTWVPSEWLVEQGVGEWMELPLWLADPAYAGMMDADVSRALEAGLELRPLAETVADTLAWVRSGEAPIEPPAGLDRDRERELLGSLGAS
jgi:nucleoside-diphosphate-sugar epimerase